MGVLSDKKRLLQQIFFIVLLLSFWPLSTSGKLRQNYPPEQLKALQSLWAEWNRSTNLDLSVNFAGWNSSQRIPCKQKSVDQAPTWRGVQCLSNIDCRKPNDVTAHITKNCSAYIIGLILNNASIEGVLPPEIGNITTLSTLKLTGNPKLTGPLPETLKSTNLYYLDLHDNAFSGTIPNLTNLKWPLDLDLSGNQFNGSFPLPQIEKMEYLQNLNLASNNFEGDVFNLSFQYLVSLNLSHNNFNGSLTMLKNHTMLKNLQILDLSRNKFKGLLPNLTQFSSLRIVNLSWNEFAGSFMLSSVNSSRLSVLDLSGNRLSSLINWTKSELGSLQGLYLDKNLINGTLNISQLSAQGFLQTKFDKSLNTLSLMNNNITNVVYNARDIADLTTVIRLQGNPFCKRGNDDDGWRCFCQQLCLNSQSHDRKVIIVSVMASATSALVLFMIGMAAILHRSRRYKRYLQLQVKHKFAELDVKPTIFSYNELRVATREFHPDMKLGEGGYGSVYKGVLPNGNIVAVKQLLTKTAHDTDDFLNEVVLITGMKHRNLINLKGCCIRGHQRILVYEYADNFDVDQILLVGPKRTFIGWHHRLKICLGVAHGLHYLHALAHPRIIHRDIKASNILLDKNYEAKVADFGLALLFPDEQSHIETIHIAGTKGYLAPEYASLGHLSDKVDVYSFGVLCLEVISGRRNINHTLHPDQAYLSYWAWKLHAEGNLMDLVDPALNLQDGEKLEVERVINISLLCLQNLGEQRPSMARVVAMLQGDSDAEVVVLPARTEEEYNLDSVWLLAHGKTGLATVHEEGGSSRRGADNSGAGTAVLELSDLRAR